MRYSLVIAVVALGLTCVATQRISGGRCRNVAGKSDFDISKFTGLWYEIEKLPDSSPFQINLKCNTETFEDKGDYMTILNKGIHTITGEEHTFLANATFPDSKDSAKLEIKVGEMEGTYFILDTDYEKFFVVYSCSGHLGLFKLEFIWIFSRKPTMDDADRDTAYKVLKDNRIRTNGLERTLQDCV